MRSSGVLVLAAWLAGGEAHADSHCISSQLSCGIVSSAPSYSYCCSDGYNYDCSSYDIPAGTLSGGYAAMSDSFVVVGPADGTPLEFTAQLTLSGSVDNRSCGRGCCYAGASGQLLEGSSNSADSTFGSACGTTYFYTTIEVPVHRVSGERFRVTASVGAGGIEGGSAYIFGTLRFSGLLEGASVISCNGFHQGPPVPVARGSWGRLKARYR